MTTGSKVDKTGANVAPGKSTTAGLELMEQLSRKLATVTAAILETVLLTCVGLGLSERVCYLIVGKTNQ